MARTRLTPIQQFNPYKFSVSKASAQTVTANTWTKVQLDTKAFDTSSNFDATTNFQFTAPIAGFYWLSALATPQALNSGISQVGINIGTFSTTPTYVSGIAASTASVTFGFGILVQLSANQTAQLYAYTPGTSFFTPMSLQGYLISAT